MDLKDAVMRQVLFCVFFATGSMAIGLSLLSEEIKTYFSNKQLHDEMLEKNVKIEGIVNEYNVQIEQVKNNPQLLRKLEHITFADPLSDRQLQDPEAMAEQLEEKRVSLVSQIGAKKEALLQHKWYRRCTRTDIRRLLFLAGSGLMLVGFVFFGTDQEGPRQGNTVK